MHKAKTDKIPVKRIISNLFWIMGFVVKYTPMMLLIRVISIVLTVIGTYISVNMTYWILQGVEECESISEVIWIIVAVFSFTIFNTLCNSVCDLLIAPKQSLKLNYALRCRLINKVKQLDQINFQTPSFFDAYTLCLNEIDSRAFGVLNTFTSIISGFLCYTIVTSISATINSTFSIWGLLAAVIPVLWGFKQQKLNFELRQNVIPSTRRRDYIQGITKRPEFSPDLKVYSNFAELLIWYYRNLTENIKSLILNYGKKSLVIEQLIKIPVVVFQNIIPWITIAILLFRKEITIPEATVLSTAALTIPKTLSGCLDAASDLYPHGLYINHVRKVFEMPINIENDEEDKLTVEHINVINVKNVQFQYAVDSPVVLDDVNIDLVSGKKYAIIGYNGAGKTTLAKLLIRMYDLSDGCIDVNEHSIKDYRISSLRSRIAYLSQDFKIYGFTIAENVLMRPSQGEEDARIVLSALEKVGLMSKINECPDGINSYVTREFDETGVYFSGGELQKLALARILVGGYDYIIMDESTSALDPISEDEIIKTIFSVLADKTIIMISHRLATLKYVDEIIFMSNGKVADHGTHRELLDRNQEYYQFYKSQADKYEL